MHIFIESCKIYQNFPLKCDIGCDFKTTISTFSEKIKYLKQILYITFY